ncbi:kinase-like domain-containing protein [Rhizophagus irregularis DAOM 181602=DAOM 197198]|nr:kinase-like domain-containing protein [Rhizophagus irregularis DAOM 181602=DAOM 197198]
MTQTAGQILGRAVPDCQWIPRNSNSTSTIAAYQRFPEIVREWTGFNRNVRLTTAGRQFPPPGGQFDTYPALNIPLSLEGDVKDRFYLNVLVPVQALLPPGACFGVTSPGFLGSSDHVLSTNNFTVAKMPVEYKTRHNLNLIGYHFWQIYRLADRRLITDLRFKFKKRILSQIFGQMACNGLHYGILSNYSDTYFLKREETSPTTLYVTRVVQPTDTDPTLRECVYYISQLAINDNVGNRLRRVVTADISSDDDDDDSDSSYHDQDDNDDPYYPDDSESSDDDDDYYYVSSGRKRKRASESSSKSVAIGITTVGEYIGGGSFGKVFSGHYNNQVVAWKTCDAYKQQEEMKTLNHEARIYSILKECQGRDVPRLFYKGYIYDRYLFALALQLIEDSRHIDPARLTKKEKELIVNQLRSIHNLGVLHNDISPRNILYEPKSRRYFFIDFGLSEIVDNKSPKLHKEEARLKKILQL